MVHRCSALGCANKLDPLNRCMGITIHTFPANKDRWWQWINALDKKNWEPKEAWICSLHFLPEDFQPPRLNQVKTGNNAKQFLLPDIVPSVFLTPAEIKRIRKETTINEAPFDIIQDIKNRLAVNKEPMDTSNLTATFAKLNLISTHVRLRMNQALLTKREELSEKRAARIKNLRKPGTIGYSLRNVETPQETKMREFHERHLWKLEPEVQIQEQEVVVSQGQSRKKMPFDCDTLLASLDTQIQIQAKKMVNSLNKIVKHDHPYSYPGVQHSIASFSALEKAHEALKQRLAKRLKADAAASTRKHRALKFRKQAREEIKTLKASNEALTNELTKLKALHTATAAKLDANLFSKTVHNDRGTQTRERDVIPKKDDSELVFSDEEIKARPTAYELEEKRRKNLIKYREIAKRINRKKKLKKMQAEAEALANKVANKEKEVQNDEGPSTSKNDQGTNVESNMEADEDPLETEDESKFNPKLEKQLDTEAERESQAETEDEGRRNEPLDTENEANSDQEDPLKETSAKSETNQTNVKRENTVIKSESRGEGPESSDMNPVPGPSNACLDDNFALDEEARLNAISFEVDYEDMIDIVENVKAEI